MDERDSYSSGNEDGGDDKRVGFGCSGGGAGEEEVVEDRGGRGGHGEVGSDGEDEEEPGDGRADDEDVMMRITTVGDS